MMMEFFIRRHAINSNWHDCRSAFKIKIDSLHSDKIIDLKIMKDFKSIWVDGEGKIPFVEAWRYDIQAAIYQEIERQTRGDFAEKLPFYIVGATKENEPDMAIISIPQQRLIMLCKLYSNTLQGSSKLSQAKSSRHDADAVTGASKRK